MAKQYYIPGKEYEWTAETWESVVQARDFEESCTCGPFLQEGVDGKSCYRVNGVTYPTDLFLHWEFMGDEEYWHFTVNEEGVEIPECLIPFYGEKESKEILSVGDLEAGKEYIMCLGVNDERNIIYWARNDEVIFITELLYHTYGHIFIKDIFHFRNIPEKTLEESLSEKYNVSLDTIKQMMDDGLIQE
jgi:hypothetical protein